MTLAVNRNTSPQAKMLEITAARAQGASTGKSEERARISAILGSEEAQGRDEQASFIAFETDMSVDSAKAMLGKSAKAEPVAATETGASFWAGMDDTATAQDGSAGSVLAVIRAAGLKGFGASATQEA